MAANIPLSAAGTGPQAPVDRELIDQYSRTVKGVAAAVSPSVVRIDVEVPSERPARGPRAGASPRPDQPTGSGSGFIVTPDGFVLTNSPCGERRETHHRLVARRPPRARPPGGRRSRHRSRRGAAGRSRAGAGPVCGLVQARGRPNRHRHRQPVWVRLHRDGRCGERARPFAAHQERAPHRRRRPDRRGAQPRQLGRAALRLAGEGDRREHGGDQCPRRGSASPLPPTPRRSS